MMAGRLPMQVVDEEPEAGSLHVGGHAAAHGAEPDEPYRHVVLGHPITVAAISDFRSAPLVSRFRSSHHCAAASFANFGIEGHYHVIDPLWLCYRGAHFGFVARMMGTPEPPH